MTRSTSRGAAVVAAAALTIGGSLAVAPAQAAEGDARLVADASFTWGISGYAQKGIFGAWVIDDLEGDVALLPGATQTEYVVAPVPATSFPLVPATAVAPNGNAVKFTDGAGVIDHVDERLEISWTGSYTVNGYPASFNAPDEIFSDPELVVVDGDATVSFDVSIGGGVDINGDPTAPVELGRITVLVASDVDVDDLLDGSARVTPDFQGVTLPAEYEQTTECTTGTGWWGSWPLEFVSVIPESVRPHYVSTGCGGMQDNKPALPFDLDFAEASAPVITVQPASVSGTHGNLAAFTVAATGTPAPTIQWQYLAPGAESWTNITNAKSVAYSRALKVSESGGKVRAVATNSEGSTASDGASLTVAAAAQATVVVDKTQLDNDRVNEIVVSGSGFDTTFAYGTRPPLANQPSGTYVAFGKFADAWRPSAGATSSARVTASGENGNGVSVLWAIPNPTLAATSPAYAVLEADGTFEVTLKADERWFDEDLAGNFGIYTYPGGGADQPAYETFTPITFVDVPDAPVVATAPKSVSVTAGSTATFTAAVTGADSLQWQSRVGSGAWADVAGATSSTLAVATTAVAQSGTQYRVVGTNDGGSVESGAATLTVTKAAPSVTLTAPSAVAVGASASVTAKVTGVSGVAAPSGKVEILAGGAKVAEGTLASGTVKVTVPAWTASGSQSLVARYVGDANYTTASSTAAKVAVGKSVASVRLSVKKSFRYGSKTKATVTVTAPAGVKAASGKVTIKNGKKVVGKGTVKNGKAKVTLTTKLRPGTRTLVARFAGDANLAATKSATTRVKVAKAKAKTTAKFSKSTVRSSKRAVLRVKVTASGTKPAGKVKVTISKGKKTVRTLTVRVKSGKTVKVRLPKLAKGKYTVKTQFQGSSTVGKKSAKKLTLRVR
ncbi:MAG: hypothetical protein GX593_03325 [Actinomycetales bacterium]|nr:hypothetical protein [Actinomycetales bacterium]